MANISRTVDVIFNGKDTLSPVVGQISKGLKKFEAAADVVIEKMDILADTFKTTALAGGAIAATLGTLAIQEFAKYESALIDIIKISSEAEVAQAGLENEVRSLALRFGESSAEILKTTGEFKRTGESVKSALLLTKNALNLASAGNTDMAISTSVLIRTMKGFGLEASEVGRVVDIVNKVSDTYATNVEQLGEGLAKLSPIAKEAGLSIEQTTAVLTPIIEVFQSGREANVAMRQAFVKLTSDSPKMIKVLDDIGVKQREGPNKELRKGVNILFDLIKNFDKVRESDRIWVAQQIIGERQATRFLKVLQNSNHVMGVEAVAKGANYAETLSQVERRVASTINKINAAGEAIRIFGRDLGDRLGPGVRSALDGIITLLDKAAEQVREGLFDELFDSFTDFGQRINAYLTQLSKILPDALSRVDYSGLIDSFNDLVSTVNDSLGTIDLTTPEGLADAIQFVVDTMDSGVRIAKGMITVYKNVKNVIVEVIRGFNNLDVDNKELFGRLLAIADTMDKAGKTLGLLVLLAGKFGGVAEGIVEHTGDWLDGMRLGFERFGADTDRMFQRVAFDVADVMNRATEGQVGLIKNIRDEQKQLFDESLAESKNLYKEQIRFASPWAKSIEKLSYKFEGAKKKLEELRKKAEETNKQKVEIKVAVLTEEEQLQKEIKRIEDYAKRERVDITTGFDLEIEQEQDIKDFLQGKGDYATRQVPFIGDDILKQYESHSRDLRTDAAATAEYLRTHTDVELEPPEDKKFEAAQKKILADIEANTERAKNRYEYMSSIAETEADKLSATFESVGDSISSTGDLLSELYQMARPGQLVDFTVQQRIAEEERRREESFQIQKRLSEAQIKLAEARTSALASGDPIITVSGDGLKPHLEAFMWEILEAIQVRVNEEQANFLLGVS